MKKFLLALVIVLPMVLPGCGSGKSERQIAAERYLTEWLEEQSKGDKLLVESYSNIKLVNSVKEDSAQIYQLDIKAKNGDVELSMPIEYYYLVLPDKKGELAAINLLTETGPITGIIEEMMEQLPEGRKTGKNKEAVTYMCVSAAFLSDKVTVIKHGK